MSATEYLIEQIVLDYVVSGRRRSYLELVRIFTFHNLYPPALAWVRLRVEEIAESYGEKTNGDQVITYNTPQAKSST